MFARTLGSALVVMIGLAFGLDAVSAQKDKETPKTKKFEVPKDAIAGKVKSVDLKEAGFTLTLPNGKDRMFAVDAKTEFWGPKGGDRGTGPAGLKDDCMAKGYEIKVAPTKDGKTAKD